MHSSFNVILFGEAGVGKSSVINLMAGTKIAETSPDLCGCTLESKQYAFQVAQRTFNVWHTVGMGEPIFSVTGYLSAVEKTYSLIHQIAAKGGLDLLLFCIPGSGSRVSQTMLYNYRLFFEVLCEKRVPIALVVTHLETEARMEDWWLRSEASLDRSGLKFSGHACVTGLPGHEKEREAQNALERLLLGYDDDERRYTIPPTSDWRLAFLTRLAAGISPRPQTVKDNTSFFGYPRSKSLKDRQKELERLLRGGGMQKALARRLADSLIRHACNPSLSTQDYNPGIHSSFNVVLFGEAGVGKSSVINLMAEKKVADTSRDARGCTLESKQYSFKMAKRNFNIWDTVGLGEPAFSASNCLGAIEQTYLLIKQLEAQGGLDLLLFCMPGSRVTATMQYNYKLFFEVLCEKRIPIAAVVTRLEDEDEMEDWWKRNEGYISEGGMKFGGHACITGQREHAKAAKARSALELLLLGYDDKGRYPMPPTSDWFFGFLERLPRIPRSKELKDKQKELEQLLIKSCKMDPADAQRLAKTVTNPSAHV